MSLRWLLFRRFGIGDGGPLVLYRPSVPTGRPNPAARNSGQTLGVRLLIRGGFLWSAHRCCPQEGELAQPAHQKAGRKSAVRRRLFRLFSVLGEYCVLLPDHLGCAV